MAAAAQFRAFEDTWEWNQDSAAMYEQLVESGGRVSDVMQAFRRFLGTNDMLAYLTMMAPRLVELRRVLKAKGSMYLHCDPTSGQTSLGRELAPIAMRSVGVRWLTRCCTTPRRANTFGIHFTCRTTKPTL